MTNVKIQGPDHRATAQRTPISSNVLRADLGTAIAREPRNDRRDDLLEADKAADLPVVEAAATLPSDGLATDLALDEAGIAPMTDPNGQAPDPDHRAVAGALGLLWLFGAASTGSDGHPGPSTASVEAAGLAPVIVPPTMSPVPQTPHPPVPPEAPRPPANPSAPANPEPLSPELPSSPSNPVSPEVPHPDASRPETPPVSDTTAPAALQLALKNDTGTGNNDRITRDATLTVTGQETGASWRYSTDGGKTWQAGSGTELLPHVSDGVVEVLVIQTDAAGNDSPTSALQFLLDTQALQLTASLKVDDGFELDDRVSSDPTVLLGNVEAGAQLDWTAIGGEFTRADDTLLMTAAAGTRHYIDLLDLRQTDVAGNVSEGVEFSFLSAPDSATPQRDVGSIRFGTRGADVFTIGSRDELLTLFNYRAEEGDVIDLSAIADSKADVVRDANRLLVSRPDSEPTVVWLDTFFPHSSPIVVKIGDGATFSV